MRNRHEAVDEPLCELGSDLFDVSRAAISLALLVYCGWIVHSLKRGLLDAALQRVNDKLRKETTALATVDVAYLDATFFADGEIPGRDMSGFPHPFITTTMDRLADLPARERAKVDLPLECPRMECSPVAAAPGHPATGARATSFVIALAAARLRARLGSRAIWLAGRAICYSNRPASFYNYREQYRSLPRTARSDRLFF